MLTINLKIAVKNILKMPVLSVLKITGLSMAILTIILIVLWMRNEFSYDRSVLYPVRTYRLTIEVNDPSKGLHSHFARCYQPWPTFFAGYFPEIEEMVRISRINNNIVKTGESKFNLRYHQVDSSFFRLFHIQVTGGRIKDIFSDPNQLIISRSASVLLFGKTDPVGKTITMYCLNCQEKKKYLISGIMEDLPSTSHLHLDLAGPFENPANPPPDWAYYYFVLKPGTDVSELEQKFPQYLKSQNLNEDIKTSSFHLQKITDIHLKSNKDRELEANGSMSGIYIFMAIGFFILCISLINFFNLQFSGMLSGFSRYRIIRLFGASGYQVFMHSATEVLIILIIALNLSIIGLELLLPAFNQFTGKEISLTNQNGAITSALVCASLFLISFLTGVLPAAILFPRMKTSAYSDEEGNPHRIIVFGRKRRNIFLQSLIVIQFTAAIVLITGTLAIWQQNNFLMSKNLGAGQEDIICVRNLPVQVVNKYEIFKSELLQNSLVKDVTSTFEDPSDEALDKFTFEAPGNRKDTSGKVLYVYPADRNIFSFYHIPFLAGRNFQQGPSDDSLPEEYILNESACQFLGWKPEEAVGQDFKLIFQIGKDNVFKGGKIVGVVHDFYSGSAKHKIEPMVYFQKSFWQFSCQVKIDTGSKKAALQYIKQTWDRIYTDFPFDYRYLQDLYVKIYQAEFRQQRLITLLTFLAIVIACLGLWSISSLNSRNRSREIGIRKVNGASTNQILVMLNKEMGYIVLYAIVISLPISVLFIKIWMQQYANHISPGISLFIVPGLVALAAAFITTSVQSFRSATINPVIALKYE